MARADVRFRDLVKIMDRLRGPDGCPWDREQSYRTLRGYLLEECYEVVDALDREDAPALREELGDLLFQVVFLARLAREDGAFDIRDVVRGIAEKMIRRHPHVFGEETARTSAQVLRNWERIKQEEKENAGEERPGSPLDGVPVALPALLKAQRLGAKAARVGFDWERDADLLDKMREELDELRDAVARGNQGDVREELGDLIFAAAMLARRMDVDAEEALEGANRKFVRRFTLVEAELLRRGISLDSAGSEQLDRAWNEVKREEKTSRRDG